jgi:hypothetical protein
MYDVEKVQFENIDNFSGLAKSFGHHVSQKSAKSVSRPPTILLQYNGGVTCDPPLFWKDGGRAWSEVPLDLKRSNMTSYVPSDPPGLTAHRNHRPEEHFL